MCIQRTNMCWPNGQQVHTAKPCAQPAVAGRMNKGNEDTLPS